VSLLLPSAVLVAVIVTVDVDAIDEGAVYKPVLLIVPTAGERDQLTVPPVAVNC
jgi:hypothetical protein